MVSDMLARVGGKDVRAYHLLCWHSELNM